MAVLRTGTSRTFKAGGTIYDARFVCFSGDNTVIAATADTDFIIGISDIPGPEGTTVTIGMDVDVIVADGVACELSMSTTCTRGCLLTATTAGQGVTTSTGEKRVGARAMQSATATDHRIEVITNFSAV